MVAFIYIYFAIQHQICQFKKQMFFTQQTEMVQWRSHPPDCKKLCLLAVLFKIPSHIMLIQNGGSQNKKGFYKEITARALRWKMHWCTSIWVITKSTKNSSASWVFPWGIFWSSHTEQCHKMLQKAFKGNSHKYIWDIWLNNWNIGIAKPKN